MEKKKYISEIPELMKEWDWEANTDLDPNKITCGSNKKSWWKCPKGHKYKQSINHKAHRHYKCPYCSNQKVLSGFNDLVTTNPKLSTEWHPTKNGDLKPSDVTSGSGKRVWWKCPLGHEYQATVHDRNSGTNCPICNTRNTTSFSEQAIHYYLKQAYPDTISRYRIESKTSMELDIYIPSIKYAVEFDGAVWHKTEQHHEREKRKYQWCKNQEIYLTRVKEKTGQKWEDTSDNTYYIDKVKQCKLDELEKIINYILNCICHSIDNIIPENTNDIISTYEKRKLLFHHGIDVNLKRDKIKIQNYLSEIPNSLADIRPDVAKKWNYEKNGTLTPHMFSVSSNIIVWWKCSDCDHEWQASINSMTRKGRYGCAICAQAQKGKTFTKLRVKQRGSLAETKPELVKDWHPTKNGVLTPYNITAGRFKPVWWLCHKCGYEWSASPNNRKKGVGCPCCYGRVPKKGVNDLATKYPELLKEWDYTKNKEKPEDVLPGSGHKVWWFCSICGKSFISRVTDRTKAKGGLLGCSTCKRKHKTKQLKLL